MPVSQPPPGLNCLPTRVEIAGKKINETVPAWESLSEPQDEGQDEVEDE